MELSVFKKKIRDKNCNNSYKDSPELFTCFSQDFEIDKKQTSKTEFEVKNIKIEKRWDPLGAAATDDEEISTFFDYKAKEKSIFNEQTHITFSSNDMEICENLDLYSNSSKLEERSKIADTNKIKSLEEEQEMLTTSLMALTSHFAQVQFRLRQIVEAPISERDELLKSLEEFAFRGIPEITDDEKIKFPKSLSPTTTDSQFELISHLKKQLMDLERLAYESGAPVLPQAIILEKQKIIIDEIKYKLNLNLNETDLPQLSSEDLRNHVDLAIGEIIGPIKMKEQLVGQLKTQITDLERFIAFLQCESNDTRLNTFEFTSHSCYAAPTAALQGTATQKGNHKLCQTKSKIPNFNDNNIIDTKQFVYNSYAAKKKAAEKSRARTISLSENKNNLNESKNIFNPVINKFCQNNCKNEKSSKCKVSLVFNKNTSESLNEKAHNILDKAVAVIHMFVLSQFQCTPAENHSQFFRKNSLKQTHTGNHWGDIRAQLELDMQEIIRLITAQKFESLINKNFQKTDLNKKKISNCDSNFKNEQCNLVSCNNITSLVKGGLSKTNQNRNDTNSIYDKIELTHVIRRKFVITLQKLIEHGLRTPKNISGSNLIVPFFDCFNGDSSSIDLNQEICISKEQCMINKTRKSTIFYNQNLTDKNDFDHDNDEDDDHNDQSYQSEHKYSSNSGCRFKINENYYDCNNYKFEGQLHAWELILEYYNIKNGESFNDTPMRKLSQSFKLNISGSESLTNKQSLLSSIGNIIAIHAPYKRSNNSHFKAFICAALNCQKLVQWLNLIFQCNDLIKIYYEPWSYVAKTGFQDALQSMDALTEHKFNLPVDLAVRQFENITDVFM